MIAGQTVTASASAVESPSEGLILDRTKSEAVSTPAAAKAGAAGDNIVTTDTGKTEAPADSGAFVSATAAELAGRYGLQRVGARPGPLAYLRDLWGHRHFTFELARSRFVARNQQDRLGLLWNVLSPLIQAAVYATVFGVLFASKPDNWAAYVVSGVFIFRFTSKAITDGARAVVGNLALVRAVHFPKIVLPVATTLIEFLGMLPAIAVLLVIMAATGEPITVLWLLVVPALLVQTVFNVGLTLVTSRITTHLRDFTQLLPMLNRMLFYLSAVFYEITRFPESIRWLMELNPLYAYIYMVRGAVLGSFSPEAYAWYVGGAWALVMLIVGYFFFWHAEERYGRE